MIHYINLRSQRRLYEYVTDVGDASNFTSRQLAFRAARSGMSCGDVLFYCPNLACHEMYYCIGSGTRKQLVPSISSRFDISCFEEEYRMYLREIVMSVDEARQVYGRCWCVYADLGYARPEGSAYVVDESRYVPQWSGVELEGLGAQEFEASDFTRPMMFGISRLPDTIDSNVFFARSLYDCNWQTYDRYCVLTPTGFCLVRPTKITSAMMRVFDDIYLANRFIVYERAIDIYCSIAIAAQDKVRIFLRSLQEQIQCMNFLGFDSTPLSQREAVSSPSVPYVVRPNLNTRMVKL